MRDNRMRKGLWAGPGLETAFDDRNCPGNGLRGVRWNGNRIGRKRNGLLDGTPCHRLDCRGNCRMDGFRLGRCICRKNAVREGGLGNGFGNRGRGERRTGIGGLPDSTGSVGEGLRGRRRLDNRCWLGGARLGNGLRRGYAFGGREDGRRGDGRRNCVRNGRGRKCGRNGHFHGGADGLGGCLRGAG